MSINNNMNKKKPKGAGSGMLFYIILLGIILIASYFFFGDSFGQADKTTLSDVQSYIDNPDYTVTDVEVNGTVVTLKYVDKAGTVKTIQHQVPYEYVDDLVIKLDEAIASGKITSYDYTEPFNWELLLNGIMIVGTVVIVIMLFSTMGKRDGGVFSFGNNRAKRTSGKDIKVTFADVAGSMEEKEELSEIVDFLKSPKKYQQLGAKIPKGVILYGPPGTGKTLLARAVAGEAGVPFYYISGSDFVEMLVGVGASRVRSLFADAKRDAPAVIFIDEIDAVGRKRGSGLGGGNDEREQTLNQILVEMDGFDAHTNIIVIAATNREDVLDPALLRPGRFDRRVMVNPPDADEREAILKIHAKGKPLSSDVDLHEVALSTTGFTGADLQNLLNEAALLSARRDKKEITSLEIYDATFRVMMGPEKKSKKLTEKSKRLTAYHEAGHAVVLRATSEFEKVDRVTIIPSGRAGGYTAYKPIEDTDFYTEKMLLDTIRMALGGRAAEELFLGEISTGASNDLKQCNRIASAMIKKYGLSPKFKNMVFGDENDEIFVGASFGQVQPYSDATAAEIDSEIQRIIDACYEDTKRILLEKKSVMEGLATRLLDKLKVDGPEFEEIYLADGDLTAIIARDNELEAKYAEQKVEDDKKAKMAEETKPESSETSSDAATEETKPSSGDDGLTGKPI